MGRREKMGDKKISKWTIIIIAIVAVVIIVGLVFLIKNKLPGRNNQAEENNINANILKDETVKKQGNLTFSDIKITPYGATNIITGKVKNTGNKIISFTAQMRMYEERNDRLLGVAEKEIVDMQPNTEEDFEINIVGDYTTVDKFMVEAIHIVEK